MLTYRLTRLQHGDEVRYPITRDDGSYVTDLSVLDGWAETLPNQWFGTRRCHACIVDGSPHKVGPPMLAQALRYPPTVPLTFMQTWLEIGTVEDIALLPPGLMPDTIGYVLTGTLKLRPTMLAALAWRAIVDGIFTGLCAVTVSDECRGLRLPWELKYVQLGPAALASSPGTRILRWWEEPAEVQMVFAGHTSPNSERSCRPSNKHA